MRIASYNVENLFERAVALSAEANDAGDEALVKQGEINVLLRKAVYSDDDRARILELLTELGLRDSDDGSELVMLRQNRGQLVRRSPERNGRGRRRWSRELARMGRDQDRSRRRAHDAQHGARDRRGRCGHLRHRRGRDPRLAARLLTRDVAPCRW